jgi:hypothetical protein
MADADGTGHIYIDTKTWVEFLRSQVPGTIPLGAEVVFSMPKPDEEGVMVVYAYSTISSPKNWENPPDFLKEERK